MRNWHNPSKWPRKLLFRSAAVPATVPAGLDFLPETALIRRHASAKATAPKQSLMLVPCCLQYPSAFSVYKPANFWDASFAAAISSGNFVARLRRFIAHKFSLPTVISLSTQGFHARSLVTSVRCDSPASAAVSSTSADERGIFQFQHTTSHTV